MLKLVVYLSFLVPLLSVFCGGQKLPYDGLENELTITISPGTIECFYQRAKAKNNLEIEYQVIDAFFGEVNINQELDISFQLFSPSGKELISDYKQSDAVHGHEAKEDGDYKFCFDNRHSHFSRKTVYFEVFVDTGSDDEDDKFEDYDFYPEMLYNDTMDQIKSSINKVKDHLNKVKHHQDQLKAIESRDRNLQEHNFTSVNRFSILIIVVMIIVGSVQVVMVRSLFEEHSKLHKIFKLIS